MIADYNLTKYQKYYGIGVEVAEYLKGRDYIKEYVKGAVYSYSRTDNPNLNLPAIFVFFDNITPQGTLGRYSVGTLRVEIVRNTAIDNRTGIYSFEVGIGEIVYNDLVMNGSFRMQLLRKFPYISFFGEQSQMDFVEGRDSVVISISVVTGQAEYEEYTKNNPYNSTNGEEIDTVNIEEVAIC